MTRKTKRKRRPEVGHRTVVAMVKKLEKRGPEQLSGLRFIQYFTDYAKHYGAREALDYVRLNNKTRVLLQNN